MLYEHTLLGFRDKVAIAHDRVRAYCPPEGYWLAFSGGKDSQVVKAVAGEAGVKYDAHFNLTTVDPPEVIRYVREYHPGVSIERPKKSMWRLIVDHHCPPTRRMRYCCEALKERGGIGRVVMTGIRWEESSMRKKRKMVESCFKHPGKVYVNPIIDWTSDDVWQFIRERDLPYCSLYDEGYERIGCILCPMARKGRKRDVERFPKYYNAYLRAFGKMLDHRSEHELRTIWQTPEEVMEWWLSESKGVMDTRQLTMFSMFE